MKFIKSKESEMHPNYVSRIIQVNETDFFPHPHPDVTALKRCTIGTDTLYNVIVSINAKPGKYVFFPESTQINPEFLRFANLYREPEMNSDPKTKPGLFDANGRVKSVRLKGVLEQTNPSTGIIEKILLANTVSDGFLIEFETFADFILSTFNIEVNINDIESGTWFDTIEHNGKTLWISKKYIPVINNTHSEYTGNKKSNGKHKKKEKKFDKLIKEQFKFHYDTTLIKKAPFVVQPEDYIHISAKHHGASFIASYVKCHQQLTWKQKLAKLISNEPFDTYDYLFASRSVIRNQYICKSVYKTDKLSLWEEAFNILKPVLEKGMTIYAELTGFTPTNTYIQKGYDYGCVQRKAGEEYIYGKHFKIMVYRITITNEDGIIHEFSPREVQIWSQNHGLVPVIEYYYGKAKDLYPELEINDNWHRDFWEKMSNDKNFYMEQNSPDCVNKVPHEGVVIKIDDMKPRAFKLKCWSFCNKIEAKELDAGVSNIEDTQE